jgi:uncharacterized protein (DUF302 family)
MARYGFSRTLEQNLDVEFRRSPTLGACNPSFARKAPPVELEIWLLMPCSIISYDDDPGGATVVALDASLMFSATGNERLAPAAAKANEKLRRVIATF